MIEDCWLIFKREITLQSSKQFKIENRINKGP